MPTTKVFGQLASLAIAGHAKIDGGLTGGTGEATTRVEFVAVDLNGDGNVTDADEGFMRVWSSNALAGAAARQGGAVQCGRVHAVRGQGSERRPAGSRAGNENCGYYVSSTEFNLLSELTARTTAHLDALTNAGARCYPGR